MSLQIGVQLYSAKNAFTKDRLGTLKKIAEIGYKHIEVPVDFSGKGVFGIGELTASDLKNMTEQAGLNIVATHVSVTEESQFDQVIAYHQELGCQKVIIPFAFFKNYEEVVAFSEMLNRYGKKLQDHGMKLYYHNHFHEFQRFNGQYALEIMLEHTQPNLVGIELDTYWAVRAGIDVTAYLERLGHRCGLIHQKDLPGSVSPINVFEVLDENEEITLEVFSELGKPENFAEIGEGVMDITSIIRATEKLTDAQYIIVEQDATIKGELESIEISYKRLSALLQTI